MAQRSARSAPDGLILDFSQTLTEMGVRGVSLQERRRVDGLVSWKTTFLDKQRVLPFLCLRLEGGYC